MRWLFLLALISMGCYDANEGVPTGTQSPTATMEVSPVVDPTDNTASPTAAPTGSPAPTQSTQAPTALPTLTPTPTALPTAEPTAFTATATATAPPPTATVTATAPPQTATATATATAMPPTPSATALPPTPTAAPTPTAVPDGDNDGYNAQEDCDDANPAISPIGVELCDGADNNCDGHIDEDAAADAGTWYADSDGDGHPNPAVSTRACAQPDAYLAAGADWDCDDGDSNVYPRADELCDAMDNDCDDEIDEDGASASIWYADRDDDGFPNHDDALEACDQPSGYLPLGDAADCDDTNAFIKPDADEVCDEIDNDCDTLIDAEDSNVVELCAEGLSCLTILNENPEATDGFYAIDPEGDGGAFNAWCNMTDHEGGWTLAASISAGNDNHVGSDAVEINGDGLVADDMRGEKLADSVIDALWTDRVWVEIYNGSGDIHCELANQPVGRDTFAYNLGFTCGYNYGSTTSYVGSPGEPPTVWINYDYRAYDNPYAGCLGAAATSVPSGAGGCGNHPPRNGALWIR